MMPFRMARPRSLAEVHAVATGGFDATVMLAGGTDQVALMKDHVSTPELVVNLKTLPDMAGIAIDADHLRIGAGTTLDRVARDEEIARRFPALVATILKAATPQVRNVATIAGNLCQRPRCSYFRMEEYVCRKKGGTECFANAGLHETHAVFDNAICSAPHVSNLAPVLIAHDAVLDVAGPDAALGVAGPGRSRVIPLEAFFVRPAENVLRENVLAPNEVITAVRLPLAAASGGAAYVEARQKQSFDWALVGATVRLPLDDGKIAGARVVLSSVAPLPVRRPDLETMLNGKRPDAKLFAAVCEAAVEGATPLRDNRYKLTMLRAVLRRALDEAKEA